VIKSRRIRLEGYVACMGEGRGVYRILVGRPEGKRPLRRPRRRWQDNIKLDLREIEIDGADWIRLAQDRIMWRAFVNTVITFGFHKERIFLTISFSNYILHHGVRRLHHQTCD
jgi:hypothetical protein